MLTKSKNRVSADTAEMFQKHIRERTCMNWYPGVFFSRMVSKSSNAIEKLELSQTSCVLCEDGREELQPGSEVRILWRSVYTHSDVRARPTRCILWWRSRSGAVRRPSPISGYSWCSEPPSWRSAVLPAPTPLKQTRPRRNINVCSDYHGKKNLMTTSC